MMDKKQKEKVWCVQHHLGWCAIKGNYRPEEGSLNIPTMCNQFVIIPFRFEKRRPDCKECKNAKG